jgi:hypothetical protein
LAHFLSTQPLWAGTDRPQEAPDSPELLRHQAAIANKKVKFVDGASKATENAATSQKPELHGTIQTTAPGEEKEIVHSISAREPLTATDQATGMSRHKECVYRTEVWLQYELFCLMLN